MILVDFRNIPRHPLAKIAASMSLAMMALRRLNGLRAVVARRKPMRSREISKDLRPYWAALWAVRFWLRGAKIRLMKTLALLLCTWLIAGCGIAIRNRQAWDMEASKAAYKACLAKVDRCERERRVFEADVAAVRALTSEPVD